MHIGAFWRKSVRRALVLSCTFIVLGSSTFEFAFFGFKARYFERFIEPPARRYAIMGAMHLALTTNCLRLSVTNARNDSRTIVTRADI